MQVETRYFHRVGKPIWFASSTGGGVLSSGWQDDGRTRSGRHGRITTAETDSAAMKVFFSAGEPSGDQHSAHLIRELQGRSSEIQFEGFGGPAMRQQGCHLLFQLTDLAVMGFLRVIPLLTKFRRLVRQAEAHFRTSPPDAVVLVDFPGFNWWIARAARRRGIPVFYYLPPQLWAWAPWRIRRVRKWVDHVICALPFEYEWYRQRGVRATWVGHPFFDDVSQRTLNDDLVQQLRGRPGAPVVALLPGSRTHEVEKNWPVMLRVMQQVQAAVPTVQWIVGNYRSEHESLCQTLLQQAAISLAPGYIVGQTSEVIEASDCCLMVSGSISLELLARNKPGVVLYRVPRIGRAVSRFLMNCRFITLTNLIADQELMPEFISHGDPSADIDRMSRQLILWLTDPAAMAESRRNLSLHAGQAAVPGATPRAAELLLREIPAAVSFRLPPELGDRHCA